MRNLSFSRFTILLIFCYSVIIFGSIFPLSDDLILEFGKKEGLTTTSVISESALRSILQGVQNENKNSIYMYGLLKLYGISVPRDPSIAAESFRRAGELGHVEAMTSYAVCLLTGTGVSQDFSDSYSWLQKALNRNDHNAKWLMGKMLLESLHTPQHMTTLERQHEAVILIQSAAEAKIAQAEHLLGLLYEYGVPPLTENFQVAADWYRRAADQNYVESMYNLALMNTYGRGFPQNFNLAESLFEAAARLNHAPSIYYIGLFKYHGYGETEQGKHSRDYVRALNWFEKAAAIGDIRISEKSFAIAQELRQHLYEANQQNERTVQELKRRSEL